MELQYQREKKTLQHMLPYGGSQCRDIQNRTGKYLRTVTGAQYIRTLRLIPSLLLCLLMLAPIGSLNAQGIESGPSDSDDRTATSRFATLTGVVTDAGNNRALPGANVVVTGTTIGATTDANGRYTINRVPAGVQNITITFIGYKSQNHDITFTGGERVTRNFSIDDDFIQYDDIVVTGVLQGQSRAFNQQRTADNIMNIVSSEQLERFPDPNMASALQRIPGVSTLHDRGEAGNVTLRGLPPGFSTVTLNGQRLATTGPQDREVYLAGVAAEMVSSLEVIKAITPDMDADAVAGSINLITARPVGDAMLFNASVAGGYNNNASDKINYRGSATWGQRFGALSALVNANFSLDNRVSEDLRLGFETRTINGTESLELTNFRPSAHLIERERYGVSGQFSYDLNPRTELFLNGMFNQYYDREERHELNLDIGRGNYIEPGVVTGNRGRANRQGRTYSQNNQLLNIGAGARHAFDGFYLDYSASFARSRYDEPFRNYFNFRQNGLNFTYDASNMQFPRYEVTNLDPNNMSEFSFQNYESRGEDAIDRDFSAGFNLTIPYSTSSFNGSIKFGGKLSAKDKEREHFRRRWDIYTGDPLTLASFGKDIGRSHQGRYNIGSIVNWSSASRFYSSNQGAFQQSPSEVIRAINQTDPNTYTAGESVYGTYLQSTMQIDRLHLLGGVRLEFTDATYTAKEIRFNDNGDYTGTLDTEGGNSYLDLFPMLHLRYSLLPTTNLRFAVTSTIARPNFIDLAPTTNIDEQSERIRMGNPELKPLRSLNLDLMAEHYLGTVGLISGGIFYKDIKNFVYVQNLPLSSGPYANFQRLIPVNGESAIVYGFELAWQQNLNFLPRVLSGLGIYANYTYSFSEAKVLIPEERTVRLPRQVPHIANLALSYQLNGFMAQASWNYQSNYIYNPQDEVVAGVLYDRYQEGGWQLDISASQRVARNVRVFAELNNLTNKPEAQYYGTASNNVAPYRTGFVSWWGVIGARFDM
ncbi:MAG: TonB-dependent receptor [Balneolaceae bacterium]|nr:MAG: TonB-dependent receptor [Balneolaceae bacterium]